MSTDLNAGYRVSVDDPFEALALLKAAVEPVYQHAYLCLLATLARGVAEGKAGLVERAGAPIVSAHLYLSTAHREVKTTGVRNTPRDLELDVCFLRDTTDGGLYALLYTWDRLVGWDAPARRGLSWSLIGDRLIADIPAVDDPEGIARFLPAVFDVASLYADEGGAA